MSPVLSQAQPLHGLAGGLLIGLAAALMLLGAGRIAGVSGITARATGLGDGDMGRGTAWLFLSGLPLGAFLANGALHLPTASLPDWPILVIAGLLVGFGTRLGSGCTSGHGVCGISRLSARSMIATAVFMLTGIATVMLVRMGGLAS